MIKAASRPSRRERTRLVIMPDTHEGVAFQDRAKYLALEGDRGPERLVEVN
jgi:hypothetical protein